MSDSTSSSSSVSVPVSFLLPVSPPLVSLPTDSPPRSSKRHYTTLHASDASAEFIPLTLTPSKLTPHKRDLLVHLPRRSPRVHSHSLDYEPLSKQLEKSRQMEQNQSNQIVSSSSSSCLRFVNPSEFVDRSSTLSLFHPLSRSHPGFLTPQPIRHFPHSNASLCQSAGQKSTRPSSLTDSAKRRRLLPLITSESISAAEEEEKKSRAFKVLF
jgi:hypothetical protein